MQFLKAGNKYFVRLDRGEEVIATLKKLCEDEGIRLGSVSGIGAVDFIQIGWFETATQEYHSEELRGDHEITALIGNISEKDGEAYLHLHITVADTQLNARGGHLNAAIISATGEIVIDRADGHLDRSFSPEIGLNLWDMDK